MNASNVVPIGAPQAGPGANGAPPASINTGCLRFDPFELDEPNALLLRDGKAVTLAPKPFAVLCALARRPGSLLTKHALLDDVWGHQFVSDSVLATAVSEVRTVLGDDSRQPRYIETVSRRGYRFIAPTSALSAVALVRANKFTWLQSFETRVEPPTAPSARSVALSPMRDVVYDTPNVDAVKREMAFTSPRPVYATAAEVNYAQELKRQLRARLLRAAGPVLDPWCLGVDSRPRRDG